jgi:hypothetical protein
VVLPLFEEFSLEEKIRLIGVGTGKLSRDGDEPEQLGLFSDSRRLDEKLEHTLDEIREKYGRTSLQKGSELS